MANTVNEQSIKKLKLLFTVIDREKGEYYLDTLSGQGINCQWAMGGLGTATSELTDLLGLNKHKAVILSVVTEEQTPSVLRLLEEKFTTVRNGKGIAFTVPLASVIGVNIYQFLSDNRYGKDGLV